MNIIWTRRIVAYAKILQEAQLTLANPRDAFRGQSTSPNIISTIPYVRYSFRLVWISNYVFKTRRFSRYSTSKWHDLEIRVRGHSRSLKVVPFYRLAWFPISIFSNFDPKMHLFWDNRLQKCRDLENWVRGPSRSLEMSPCDRAHMTSY